MLSKFTFSILRWKNGVDDKQWWADPEIFRSGSAPALKPRSKRSEKILFWDWVRGVHGSLRKRGSGSTELLLLECLHHWCSVLEFYRSGGVWFCVDLVNGDFQVWRVTTSACAEIRGRGDAVWLPYVHPSLERGVWTLRYFWPYELPASFGV